MALDSQELLILEVAGEDREPRVLLLLLPRYNAAGVLEEYF